MSVSQGRDLSLVVLAHSPVARNPTECAFHDESGAAPDFRHGCLEHVPPLPVPTHLSFDTRPPTPVRALAASAQIFAETRHKILQSCKQTASAFGIVRIGGSDIDRDGNPQRINQEMSFAAFDPLMGIKAADSCRFLNGFHADVASTTAALGSECLPRRSRQGSVQCTPQERPDPIRVASAGSGKKPSATVESRLASSAKGTPFAGRRRSHRKWHARSGLAAFLVWAEEGDGVADTPTPHPKDCWDNSYSSFQFITALLSLIPKHSLRAATASSIKKAGNGPKVSGVCK
jgi:hypothetical protein